MALARLAQRFFSRGPRLSKDALKGARPMRNPLASFEFLDDGSILIEVPLSTQGKGVLAALARMTKAPNTKKFELEPIGAFVWNLCDGKQTYEGIARQLREHFKMSRFEAEAALTAFLQMLAQRRLVTMMVKKKGK